MRISWATDVHLDFVRHKDHAKVFYDQIKEGAPDAVIVTGDISNGQPARFLRNIADVAKVPVYFVLGNHDFYNRAIGDTRAEVDELCQVSGYRDEIFYLPRLDPVPIEDGVVLVGVDGWADGRAGDWRGSDVWLSDYIFIKDIARAGQNRSKVREKIQELSDCEALLAREKLNAAFCAGAKVAVFATHVPPWRESSWYAGKMSDKNYAPHFVSVAVGNAIQEVLQNFPDRRVLVLCGHTHGRHCTDPIPRVISWGGEAEYGRPCVQTTLDVRSKSITADNGFYVFP